MSRNVLLIGRSLVRSKKVLLKNIGLIRGWKHFA
jgi:hypothetical protein